MVYLKSLTFLLLISTWGAVVPEIVTGNPVTTELINGTEGRFASSNWKRTYDIQIDFKPKILWLWTGESVIGEQQSPHQPLSYNDLGGRAEDYAESHSEVYVQFNIDFTKLTASCELSPAPPLARELEYIQNLTTDPARETEAKSFMVQNKQRTLDHYKFVSKDLSTPRLIFSQKDIDRLQSNDSGVTLHFHKQIGFVWFGEYESIALKITATPKDRSRQTVSATMPEMDFFEDTPPDTGADDYYSNW